MHEPGGYQSNPISSMFTVQMELMVGTIAFCLHLEVAQVGISMKNLQENAEIVDSKGSGASWQSGGQGFDPPQLHQ
jgi:hypothetical protein